MEIDFTSAYLYYPLPQCSKIVTSIIFSISYELFRLPSAKVSGDVRYPLVNTDQGLRCLRHTVVWVRELGKAYNVSKFLSLVKLQNYGSAQGT